MAKDYSTMTAPQLEQLRELVLDRIAAVPLFRRGSLQVGYRKCGKKSCRCARPGEQGHGPRGLWTRTAGGGSRGQYVRVDQIEQVRAQLENYAAFADLVAEYVEINEALCTAQTQAQTQSRTLARTRSGPPGRVPARVPVPRSAREKGGSATGKL